jgi:CRISPR-associated endonuclease Cas2
VRLLEASGVRSQFSVFECLLTNKQFNKLKSKIGATIDATDKVHYFPLCNKDLAARKADGLGEVIHFPQYTIG